MTVEIALKDWARHETFAQPDYKNTDWNRLRMSLVESPPLDAVKGLSNVNAAWSTWKDLSFEKVQQHATSHHCNTPEQQTLDECPSLSPLP